MLKREKKKKKKNSRLTTINTISLEHHKRREMNSILNVLYGIDLKIA